MSLCWSPLQSKTHARFDQHQQTALPALLHLLGLGNGGRFRLDDGGASQCLRCEQVVAADAEDVDGRDESSCARQDEAKTRGVHTRQCAQAAALGRCRWQAESLRNVHLICSRRGSRFSQLT